MLGTFQQSNLRIEVEADQAHIQASLMQPGKFRLWLWPQRFDEGLPGELYEGLAFKSHLGPIEIQHTIQQVTDHNLYMLLAGGIDGFHEWYWGDHWLQSRLEGVSPIPLNIGQSLVLFRLKQFLTQPEPAPGQG